MSKDECNGGRLAWWGKHVSHRRYTSVPYLVTAIYTRYSLIPRTPTKGTPYHCRVTFPRHVLHLWYCFALRPSHYCRMLLVRMRHSSFAPLLPSFALLGALLLAFILLLNQPAVRFTQVMYPDGRPEVIPPYSSTSFRGSEQGVYAFAVRTHIQQSLFSSGIVRVSADDCLDVITVNGVMVDNRREQPGEWRCRIDTQHRLDLSEWLTKGANTAIFTVANRGGSYGIHVTPIYSPLAILGITLCCAILVYSVAAYAFTHVRSFASSLGGRLLQVAFLPGIGLLLLAMLSANNAGPDWLSDHLVPTLVTVLIPALLGLTALIQGGQPSAAFRNYWCATGSVACFLWSFHLLSAGQWSNPEIRWYAVAGLFIGLGATLPLRDVATRIKQSPRILAIIAVAVASPHIYWHYNLALWGSVGTLTGKLVQGLLWAVGVVTTISNGQQVSASGIIEDVFVYVSSPTFSVKIGSWCSGFEGTSYFLFLLSLFVLLDWKLFSTRKYLWVAFLLTVPFALFVNSLRIASLFLYAEWNVWRYGHSTAVWATVEAFHSNIGWAIYSVAFAVLLPLIYRWARQSGREDQITGR